METKQILREAGFHYSKSLGQNFLFDERILGGICEAAGVGADDNVLEIGPGAGTLTRALAARAKRVVAVEIDRALEPVLRRQLEGCANASVVYGDAMRMDPAELARDAFGGERFMLVANLPYYVTTPVLMRFLEADLPLFRLTVMVQREVADRMVAAAGTKAYGALSVAVQYRCEARIAMHVPSAAFTPPPKVDSSLVRLDVYAQRPVVPSDERTFLAVARAAFAMRRKTMTNNLLALGLTRAQAEEALISCDLDPRVRGETLDIPTMARLSDAVSRYGNIAPR